MNLESRLEEFVSSQDNLDAMYWMMKGMSYEEISERIGKPDFFVQRVSNFLRNNGLLTGGQWRVDANAMGMTKSLEFYDYHVEDPPYKVRENDDFLTYFADIENGKHQYLAMYTFPNEVSSKIGEVITPFYYLVPKFKAPLLQNRISLGDFEKIYESENNENPLPPRGEPINPDIIHIESPICGIIWQPKQLWIKYLGHGRIIKARLKHY